MTLGVALTYYNERQLLTECLESLRHASQPDEILVYDDASAHPAEIFVPRGMKVRLIRGERNLGPAKARNLLLAESDASYIHFHDCDDLFHADWAQRVRRVMAGEPDVILTEIDSFKEGVLYREKVVELFRLERDPDLVRFALAHPILPAAGTYRREFLKITGGYREDLWQSEDYEFHIRLAAQGARYQVIPDGLVRLRLRPESRSQRQREVWESRLLGLQSLQLPALYSDNLAEAFAETGAKLHGLKSYAKALEAFSYAQAVGQAQFLNRPRLYRWIAGWFGPSLAESLSAQYRRRVPNSLRQWLRGRRLQNSP